MKVFHTVVSRRTLPLLLVLVLVLMPAAEVDAYVTRTEGAGESLPYYARIGANEISHDGEWAAIVFYRPPDCEAIQGFNLLDFYDFSAFSCTPATTDGFILWEGDLGVQPLLISLHGLGAVPVWFVSWPELQGAITDGKLDTDEVEALPSLLRGSAGHYQETLHPTGSTGRSGVGMIEFNAKGSLEDGRTFMVKTVWAGTDQNPRVHIEFR